MKISNIFIAAIFLLHFGCIKEDSTIYKANLINQTSHQITILPYKKGVINKKDSIFLNPGDNFEIANGYIRGLIDKPFFSTEYFAIEQGDSIVVFFDKTFPIVHYNYILPQKLFIKNYLRDSNRNLNNREGSYKFDTKATSKHQRHNQHTYTFTEQDYLDAK